MKGPCYFYDTCYCDSIEVALAGAFNGWRSHETDPYRAGDRRNLAGGNARPQPDAASNGRRPPASKLTVELAFGIPMVPSMRGKERAR